MQNKQAGTPAPAKKTLRRPPDFVGVTLDVAIPNPWTLTLVGVSFAVEMDKHGNVYGGLGPSVGKSASEVSVSATANWLNQKATPSVKQLNNFLTKSSFSFSAGTRRVGVQEQWTPGSGTATGGGYFTPQIGVGYTYSWKLFSMGDGQ